MPTLTRDDGVEIHWEEQGEGPLVLLAPYWSGHPSAFENLINELVTDHRLVTYDARGTGRSARSGPHDMETAVADRSAHLVHSVVGLGAAPLSRKSMQDADALVGSDSVIEAFFEMLENSYRGAMRTLMTATNPQMSEAELQERISQQVEYCPHEVALERVHAWEADDATEQARRIGDRLLVLFSERVAGPWLPAAGELDAVFSRLVPEARLVPIEDGMVSRPDLTAAVVRDITSIQSSS